MMRPAPAAMAYIQGFAERALPLLSHPDRKTRP